MLSFCTGLLYLSSCSAQTPCEFRDYFSGIVTGGVAVVAAAVAPVVGDVIAVTAEVFDQDGSASAGGGVGEGAVLDAVSISVDQIDSDRAADVFGAVVVKGASLDDLSVVLAAAAPNSARLIVGRVAGEGAVINLECVCCDRAAGALCPVLVVSFGSVVFKGTVLADHTFGVDRAAAAIRRFVAFESAVLEGGVLGRGQIEGAAG